jgi:protein disulfide isomerase
MAAAFDEASLKLRRLATLVEVNCATDAKACDDHGIKAYPSLRLFRNGKMFESFWEERSTKAMVAFVSEKVLNADEQAAVAQAAAASAAAATAAEPAAAAAAAEPAAAAAAEPAAASAAAEPAAPPPSPADLWETRDGSVLIGDGSTWDALMQVNDYVFVKFYSPQCGHCIRMADAWREAAKTNANARVTYAQLNVVENEPLRRQHRIDSYPGMVLFQRGGTEFKRHSGPRDAASFLRWVDAVLEPIAAHLQAAADVSAFLARHSDKHVMLAHREKGDNVMYNVLAASMAEMLVEVPNLIVATVASESLLAGAHASLAKKSFSQFASLIVPHAPSSAGVKEPVSTSLTGAGVIKAFIRRSMMPRYATFDAALSKTHGMLELPTLVALVSSDAPASVSDEARALVLAQLDKHSELLGAFVLSAQDKTLVDRLMITAEEFAAQPVHFAVVLQHKKLYYKWAHAAGESVGTALDAFVSAYFKGEVKPLLRSERIPTEQPGPVHVVVTDAWASDVLDPALDVLVEVYAPWCFHCQRLEPTYNELATKLKAVPTLRIAKINGAANDVPSEYNVRGFPTLIFFPAGERKGTHVNYAGPRTLESFVEFLRKHATHPIGELPA